MKGGSEMSGTTAEANLGVHERDLFEEIVKHKKLYRTIDLNKVISAIQMKFGLECSSYVSKISELKLEISKLKKDFQVSQETNESLKSLNGKLKEQLVEAKEKEDAVKKGAAAVSKKLQELMGKSSENDSFKQDSLAANTLTLEQEQRHFQEHGTPKRNNEHVSRQSRDDYDIPKTSKDESDKSAAMVTRVEKVEKNIDSPAVKKKISENVISSPVSSSAVSSIDSSVMTQYNDLASHYVTNRQAIVKRREFFKKFSYYTCSNADELLESSFATPVFSEVESHSFANFLGLRSGQNYVFLPVIKGTYESSWNIVTKALYDIKGFKKDSYTNLKVEKPAILSSSWQIISKGSITLID